ncbi:Por secretion system C-terminal sorting domain-containing protein [Lishizhenia tianjinensis]|uniref:Por secretion system C-terminal sorting domain-containing protein n=1 Tax=Lishizhenia tianjinensis TaxID=477690 RepID=A0A1I7BDT2_9FLAO|nr:T9SS type A sorting domain-containing protein [Lishizhenia tianjinensis]SFT85386.1 Por secretion system C-terminal sorting domain-containing protein [Lishizhenia tianjinensis]
MKTLIQTILILLSFYTCAQNFDYYPFHGKIQFEPLDGIGETTFLFHSPTQPITQLSSLEPSPSDIDSCSSGASFYSPAVIYNLDNWLGLETLTSLQNNGFQLTFRNNNRDAITTYFTQIIGDSTLLYTDTNMVSYYLKLDHKSEELIYGNLDSVLTYTIHKYDNSGISLTHNFGIEPIQLSKNYGLTAFINLRNFPSTQKEFRAIGSYENQVIYGDYPHITFDELYPWQPGDTLIYKGVTAPGVGTFTETYVTYIITSRVENNGYVEIYWDRDVFHYQYHNNQVANIDTTTIDYTVEYPNPISFVSGKVAYSSAPVTYTTHYQFQQGEVNFYGDLYPTYKKVIDAFNIEGYCPFIDRIIPYYTWEVSGTFEGYTYTANFGQTEKRKSYYPDLWTNYDTYAELIYANIGGNRIGTKVYLNSENPLAKTFVVYPNPVEDLLTIKNTETLTSCSITDLQGNLLLRQLCSNGPINQIDLSAFPAGVYLLQLESDAGITCQKIIKN